MIGAYLILDMNAELEIFAVGAALVFLALGYSLYTVYRDGYDPLALIKTGELIER
jgi:hypothetical protein